MPSLHSIHAAQEGRIAAEPLHRDGGRVSGAHEPHHRGKVHSAPPQLSSPLQSEADPSTQNAAVAEIANLIASLESLSTQAQNLPLSPPSPAQAGPARGYRPQTTDYTQLAGDAQ